MKLFSEYFHWTHPAYDLYTYTDLNQPGNISLGKPADIGDFLLDRRFRLLSKYVPDHAVKNRILDYGCGNGAQTMLVAKSGVRIDALDVSEEQCQLTEENLKSFKNVNVMLYDGNVAPFDANTFDFVYSFEVLEHTQDDRKSVEDIYRILKPGGCFLFTVPNKWWIFETHGANLPYLRWNRVPFFSWLPSCLHSRWARARIYTKSGIVRLMKNTGFEIKRLSYITAPLDALRFKPVRYFLRATLFSTDETPIPFMATAIMCVCYKA